MLRRSWTKEDKAILQQHYRDIGASGCMLLLPERTREEIRAMASYIGASTSRAATPLDLFETKFTKGPGCWLWRGGLNSDGYGQFCAATVRVMAHRFSYMAYIGPITPGLHVCHRCDNRACVNPAHLWLGTNAENSSDRSMKGRSARIYGEQNKAARLSERQVMEIRSSTAPERTLAAQYGVSPSTVYRIRAGKSWTHLACLGGHNA